MALPALIEIVPPGKPREAQITVPGSKSITNRALVLAALAGGETVLPGALWSEDTQVMVECLQELGFMVNVEADPGEPGNRTLTVYGKGGEVPRGGTQAQPLDLFVGNAGTAARFLTAFLALGSGVYRLHGVPRMHERPQAALFHALRELGYRVDSSNDKLPALVHGGGPRPGTCRVSILESSQFASALLLSGRVGGWRVEVAGENADESPYVVLTEKMLAAFPQSGGRFAIEADASSASYFCAAGQLRKLTHADRAAALSGRAGDDPIRITRWPHSGWQMDERFPALFTGAPGAAGTTQTGLTFRQTTVSRRSDLGDSILTAMILAPFASDTITFTDLGRLRLQECERVHAMRAELTKCGARVVEQNNTLIISPSALHNAEIETYDDHRIAMCFAVLGLAVPGIRIRQPACVKKTFPNFFQKLAAPAPAGLGASIRDALTGKALYGQELFAD
ncbi:MAG TPA: 3-phosphoshikimate 1-carboxyvinyltransferase [Verrucomicrobiae bacterium]|nr:3-phosphoshikimate 1-carboxyvinyltransferase [Verrucomicrobiae bacterium]